MTLTHTKRNQACLTSFGASTGDRPQYPGQVDRAEQSQSLEAPRGEMRLRSCACRAEERWLPVAWGGQQGGYGSSVEKAV